MHSGNERDFQDVLPIVTTATEFLAVADDDEIGKAVAFEIEPGRWLRSDLKSVIDLVRGRLEAMAEVEQFRSEIEDGSVDDDVDPS